MRCLEKTLTVNFEESSFLIKDSGGNDIFISDWLAPHNDKFNKNLIMEATEDYGLSYVFREKDKLATHDLYNVIYGDGYTKIDKFLIK